MEFGITARFRKPFSVLYAFKYLSYGMRSEDFLYLITTAFSIVTLIKPSAGVGESREERLQCEPREIALYGGSFRMDELAVEL